MNSYYDTNREMKTDFREIFWRLLSQWKAIALVVLITTVLVSGVQYYKLLKSASSGSDGGQDSITPADTKIEAILEPLNSEDRNKIEAVLHQREWIEKQRAYVSNSLLFKMDMEDMKALKMVYFVDDEDPGYPRILGSAYLELLKSDRTVEVIRKAINTDTDNRFIKELLFSAEDKEYDAGNHECFSFYIALPDGVDSEILKETVNNVFKEYNKELSQKIHQHRLILLDAETTETVNDKAAQYCTDTLGNINSLRTSLAAAENDLNDTQKGIYNTIVALKKQTAQQAAAENTALAKVHVSKKYIIAGIVMGLMLYVLAYAVFLVYRCRVYSVNALSPFTTRDVAGTLYIKNEHKGIANLFHSDFIDRLHYKNQNSISEQIDRTASSVAARCKNKHIKELSIICMSKISAEIGELIDGITHNVKEDVRINVICAEDGIALNEVDLAEAQHSLEIIVGDVTPTDGLIYSYELQKNFDINNIGVIYVQSY